MAQTFNLTAYQIVAHSYQTLRVYGAGDAISTNNLNYGMDKLNMMVKSWEAQGIHLWTMQEAAIFLTVGQQVYNLIPTSGDMAGDTPIFNTLTNAGVGTSITVTSTLGITANDNIGICLDNNTIQWTTVSSVTSTTTLSLNATITSTASAGNNVFSFTNKVNQPLDITSCRFFTNNQYERPIGGKGREEFMQIPNKILQGKANQFFYTPNVSSSLFYVWPVADSVQDCLKISYVRKIQDFVNTTDNADIPQEWLNCIILNLAVLLAPACGKVLSKDDPDLLRSAQEALIEMNLWDADRQASTKVVPNYRYDS